MIEKVTVVGHIALDFVFDIPYHPEKNHSIFIKNKERYFGGGAANIAAGIAKLGCRSELVAAVGQDFEGSEYHSYLKNLGVELEVEKFRGEIPRAYIFNDEEQNQVSYFYWGVSDRMGIMKARKRDVVHIAPSHPEFACRMAERAKFVAFEPGQDIPRYDREKMSFIMEKTDILFCNVFELNKIKKITNKGRMELAERMDMVVTEGEKGSTLYHDGKAKKIPAVKSDVVDPTGAGDAYRAAFWAGMMKGLDMETSCKLGSTAASMAVKARGAQSGMPGWEELMDAYESNFGK